MKSYSRPLLAFLLNDDEVSKIPMSLGICRRRALQARMTMLWQCRACPRVFFVEAPGVA